MSQRTRASGSTGCSTGTKCPQPQLDDSSLGLVPTVPAPVRHGKDVSIKVKICCSGTWCHTDSGLSVFRPSSTASEVFSFFGSSSKFCKLGNIKKIGFTRWPFKTVCCTFTAEWQRMHSIHNRRIVYTLDSMWYKCI